ncbi:MAG: hypothetical protein JO212_11470 [Acetobacteraceae bacterium]|nr:hypothetical protein [Acetobacteraceae bacterium]MBV8590652.1 hypothetical protein [Acetobacteraceae bacterium]
MPFDAAVASARLAPLSEILENNGLTPVPWERLAAHKQSQLEKFPPSFWYRHSGLLRIGLFVSFAALAPLSAMAAHLPWSLPCFIGFGWLALLILPLAATLHLRAGAHWEERRLLESSLAPLGIPEPIHKVARQMHQEVPGSALVLGELVQDRVVLDPYLLLVRGNERVCLGIWEDSRIIACAG